MQYTQEQLTEIWQILNKGNELIDDPIDSLGSLTVFTLKSEPRIQSMMVQATSPPMRYTDYDDALPENRPAMVFSRVRTQEDTWDNWYAE
jgi:hypothetical protein